MQGHRNETERRKKNIANKLIILFTNKTSHKSVWGLEFCRTKASNRMFVLRVSTIPADSKLFNPLFKEKESKHW